eukprot:CAMPEP_0197564184 /NCGR_PEP_ID=MMETSP1320-20131121/30019_1 /TAXON_ID=91990 /ORGANISM="Bolidomonas sp., Strain RCC2347" /LENGTH=51 /DNA_ID=CAMNT_0043126081 /DNA_START=20 /DNA_END=175 /DNA_ORIENTATION=-
MMDPPHRPLNTAAARPLARDVVPPAAPDVGADDAEAMPESTTERSEPPARK